MGRDLSLPLSGSAFLCSDPLRRRELSNGRGKPEQMADELVHSPSLLEHGRPCLATWNTSSAGVLSTSQISLFPRDPTSDLSERALDFTDEVFTVLVGGRKGPHLKLQLDSSDVHLY